ncbi:MAG TPA: replication/maintenance protein RepL [Saprospiraceae bacterium]|nr:replication/maintenance protein RepL [Saprospiraceae bacterium]
MNSTMVGKVQIQTDTYTDFETGEIKEEITVFKDKFESEPSYIKFYTADMLYLSDIPSGLNSILIALMKRMSYNNDIFINSSLKRVISAETGKKFDTVNKAISAFVRGDILIRKDTGYYLFNPFIFGRGQWKDIKKIRVTIDYTLSGRTFSSLIESSTDVEEVENENN